MRVNCNTHTWSLLSSNCTTYLGPSAEHPYLCICVCMGHETQCSPDGVRIVTLSGGLPRLSSPFRCACAVGPALVVDRVCAGARVIRSAHLFARAVARAGHERTCSPDCVWIVTRPGGLPRHPSPSDALASLDPRWPDGHSRAGALVTRCPLLPSLTQQLGRECAFPCHAIVRLRLPRQYHHMCGCYLPQHPR